MRLIVRTTVLLLVVVVIGVPALSTLAHAYDPRLDEAVAALQKAAALAEAASTDPVSARTQRRFDHHIDRALTSIEEAMGHLVAAGVAADSETNPQ
jgi:hypothetical protein